jgi:hypothetical protein
MSRLGNKKFIATCFAVAMCAPAAFAGFHEGNAVTFDGQPAFTMADAYGYSADQRAWQAQDALDNALVLANDVSPSAVRIERMNGAVIISLDGRKVATVDANSASRAGLSVDALANKWADSLKGFLADSARTEGYLLSLKNPHQVEANVAIVEERKLYAPAGTTLPIVLVSALTPATIKSSDLVEGVVHEQVVLGNYAIPAGSRVIGKVAEIKPDTYTVKFNSLTTPSGTEMPITATLVNTYSVMAPPVEPYLVSTYAIPAGSANGQPLVDGRIPAHIGLGAAADSDPKVVVLTRDSSVLTASQPLTIMFEETTPVSVVSIQHHHGM